MLFIFAVEILAVKLRDDTKVKGYTISHNNKVATFKISQYADDSVIILKDISQIDYAISLVEEFGQFAGLKLNFEKTKIILLGSARGSLNMHKNIECVENVKSLGVLVGYDTELCITKNWTDKITRMEKILQQWRNRSLTIIGKIVIIKSLILPQISFSILHCVMPNWVIKRVTKLFFGFLWGKTDKVKRDTMIGDIKQGGLKMIDFKSHCLSLKASWIKRIGEADINSSWINIPSLYLRDTAILEIIPYITSHEITKLKPFEKLPPFYKQVIEGYVQCNAPYTSGSHSNNNTVNVLNMCIWGNRNIRNKTGDILYFPNWIRSGMVQIKDLNIIEGKINENYIFTKLSHKSNYLSEMYQVKQGLHDFLSDNITCSVDTISTKKHAKTTKTSGELYNSIVSQKFVLPKSHTYFKNLFNLNNFDFSSCYKIKVQQIPDKKICDFNFKLLSNILACRKKLFKWQVIQSENCMLCNSVETIEHLLFTCPVKLEIWNRVCTCLNVRFDVKTLVLGVLNFNTDWAISVVTLCIYKYWSWSNDAISDEVSLATYIRNLKLNLKNYITIYKVCNFDDVSKKLEIIYSTILTL